MVTGTFGNETKWRMAFYYRLQSAKQGDNKRGLENSQYEEHAAAHRKLKATRFRGGGPYSGVLPNSSHKDCYSIHIIQRDLRVETSLGIIAIRTFFSKRA